MSRFVDAIIAYRILRKLSTPFNETEAYRLGIIDDRGKILRRFSDLKTTEEKDSYTLLDRLVWRVKRIIERVPYASQQIVSFAAALSLIKEHLDRDIEPMATDFESRLLTLRESHDLESEMQLVENFFAGLQPDGSSMKSFRNYNEEIANAVGGGFSGQATSGPNPHLAGRDILLGKRIQRRKRNNV